MPDRSYCVLSAQANGDGRLQSRLGLGRPSDSQKARLVGVDPHCRAQGLLVDDPRARARGVVVIRRIA